jgi:hypothetical protein
MQDFAPFITWTPGCKGRRASSAERCAVRINLSATFQFSPATSKYIDFPA